MTGADIFLFSWNVFELRDECFENVNGSDGRPVLYNAMVALACYSQLVMTSFVRINASWITYNAYRNPEQFGWTVSDQHVENLLETQLEVYSGTKCKEKFSKV